MATLTHPLTSLVIDGAPVALSGGEMHLLIPPNVLGITLPFWIKLTNLGVDTIYAVQSLPWYWQGKAQSVSLHSTDPASAADYQGITVPAGVKKWTVNTGVSHLPILGWGSLETLGQEDGFANAQNMPNYFNAAVQAYVDLGFTWIGFEVAPGMLTSDADYFTPWLNQGLPYTPGNQTAEYQAFREHKFNPIAGGTLYPSYLNWRLAFLNAVRAEAAVRGIQMKVFIKYFDTSDGTYPGSYITPDNPSEYAAGILRLWQYLDTTFGFVPDQLDLINEPGFANTWTAAKIVSCAQAVNSLLSANGYTPLFSAPSETGMAQFTQSEFNTIRNGAIADGWNSRWKPSSHNYHDGVGDAAVRSSFETFALKFASVNHPIAAVATEDLNIALGLLTAIHRGRFGGSNNYTFATPYTGQTLGRRGSIYFGDINSGGLQSRLRTYGNAPIWKALKPGYVRIDSIKSSQLADADNAELVAVQDPATQKITIAAVFNEIGPKYVDGLTPGRYRLTYQLHRYNGTDHLRGDDTPSNYTIGAADTIGVTYDVATGQGIYINEHQADAAGTYILTQETT